MSTGQWQDVRDGYLRQIEKELSQVDPVKRAEILANVREHLEVKYTQLTAEQRSSVGYQQIIAEMGPPEDYAELLDETQTAPKRGLGLNAFLTAAFVVALAAVGGYLFYTSDRAQASPVYTFEPDERVVGTWVAIDYVRTIKDFNPLKKNLQGDVFLKSLTFNEDGSLIYRNTKTDRYMQCWTKGKVGPDSERPAFYYLRSIDGQTYMFYEWISGDVTLRGREPSYYVLARESDAEAAPAWFENDSKAIGHWSVVDFVQTKDEFVPGQTSSKDLFIKTMHFEDNGTLRWTVGDSAPIAINWTKGRIRPFDSLPASYEIQTIDQTEYLFYEHRTLNSRPKGYYIFQRTNQPEPVTKAPEAFVCDPDVLGKWKVIDFIEKSEMFDPDNIKWHNKFYLNSMHFKDDGFTELLIGEDRMLATYRWTKGKLFDDQEELDPGYTLQHINGNDYLFYEWNSGDVTLRGHRPAYYVFKREE